MEMGVDERLARKLSDGSETEKPKLAAAYEDAARLALSSMERALPSSILEPPASAAINNQTAAIMAAVSGRSGETSPIQIHIEKMEICDESDVERVARELYRMAAQESRSRGGGFGNVYDECSESILCTFECPAGKTVPEMCREIAYWLSGTGRLAYNREPDKYYTASVSGSPPMEQYL